MERKQKVFILVGLLAVVLLAGIVGFMVVGGNASSSSASENSGDSTIFIIMISQIPIWTSLAMASRKKRKKKEAEKSKRKEKNDYYSDDADYFVDKELSADDGEIVGYDELEEESSLYHS